MRRTLVGAILTCLSFNALAADDSVFGTHWVKFQPIQVAGDVQGCQLTFLTVTADRVYLNGNQVAVNGSIVLSVRGEFPIKLRWKSDEVLEIDSQASGSVRENMVNGISIEYTAGNAF